MTMTMVIMRSTINEELQLQIYLAECLLILPSILKFIQLKRLTVLLCHLPQGFSVQPAKGDEHLNPDVRGQTWVS